MASQELHIHVLSNGFTLIVEPMRAVQSASFSLAVPAGCIYEEEGKNGTAAVLCELITRGAGSLDSRELSTQLDYLGLQRSESVGWNHLSLNAATVAENLLPALKLYAEIVQHPHLPEDQFPAAIAGVEQSLRALEDEPRQKVMIELCRRCYHSPWGRPSEGDLEELPNITPGDVTSHFRRHVRPGGSILGVAGNVEFELVRDLVEEAFADWAAGEPTTIQRGPRGVSKDHLNLESTQTQIGLAFPSVPYRDDRYYAAWAAVNVLSGGSSSRLFTEVREKRGLCYSIYASLNSLLDEGRVLAYAGTTTERAQETLDVMVREIQRLGEGIEEAELDRCKASAKSALIMQQESTSARAASLTRDWFHLGRVTTLDEVHRRIDALKVPEVLHYVQMHPPDDLTLLTIGPEPLEMPDGVS